MYSRNINDMLARYNKEERLKEEAELKQMIKDYGIEPGKDVDLNENYIMTFLALIDGILLFIIALLVYIIMGWHPIIVFMVLGMAHLTNTTMKESNGNR